ncbi:MAG: integrase arm-type DNA-binding domain-containing protein, partial [Colwellia sp.]
MSDGKGLMLRVKPSGIKSWLFNYYHPVTRKRKNQTLGQYPSISLANARKKRTEAKELLAQDVDPIESRNEKQSQKSLAASHTLLVVSTAWFELKKTKVAKSTAISLWRALENHVFPELGHMPIAKILAPVAIKVLKPLAAKGTLETTSKLIGYLNEMMNYAVNTGLLHHNSLAGIKAAFETPKAQNMLSLKPEELPELMRALSYT